MKSAVYVFAVLFMCSFVWDEDPFEMVINNQKTDSVKQQLRKFKNEGIEKPLVFMSQDSDSSFTDSVDIEKIISTARSYLGTRHAMGGTSKKGIDCSGMVMMSVKSSKIVVPHNSHEQGRYGKIVAVKDSLKRGDLVFFYGSFKSYYFITHSGIYVGENKFIHASASAGVIITDINDGYWKPKYLFGTRLVD
jgi:murein DD-endopeptidase / murein LD-carboxypeptidase